MKKKIVALGLSLGVLSALFTGCRADVVTENEKIPSTNDSSKLKTDMFYVWHDESQQNLENDVSVDITKFKDYEYDIFKPVYQEMEPPEDISVGDSKRVMMFLAENEENIPTLYKGDALVFYSEDTLPYEYTLERFYDHGYSFGFYGLEEYIAGSENFVINSTNTSEMGCKKGSSAEIFAEAFSSEEAIVSFPFIGDTKVTTKNVSTAGTVKGLLLGSEYNVDVYFGTKRVSTKLTVDTRIMSSYEELLYLKQYSFVGENIVKVELPSFLKTGYYNINGIGIFRYVDGDSYDTHTDFNEPNLSYDEDGTLLNEKEIEAYLTDSLDYSELDNDDAINDNKKISTIKKQYDFKEGDKIQITAAFSNAEDDAFAWGSKDNSITITYYLTPSSADGMSDSLVKGTKSNPMQIVATSDEMAMNNITREIEIPYDGNWTFVFDGVGEYTNHMETIKKITDTVQ